MARDREESRRDIPSLLNPDSWVYKNQDPFQSKMSATHYGTSSCLRSFAQVCKSLQAASLSISGQIQLDALEDEIGRFRVWAGNLGALQRGHSSLDYRLREAPLVRENVMKLLKELHECLQESTSIWSREWILQLLFLALLSTPISDYSPIGKRS
jgi:hypothetical protein